MSMEDVVVIAEYSSRGKLRSLDRVPSVTSAQYVMKEFIRTLNDDRKVHTREERQGLITAVTAKSYKRGGTKLVMFKG